MTMHLSQDLLAQLKADLENKKKDLEEQISLLNSEDVYKLEARLEDNAEDADEASEDQLHEEVKIKLVSAQQSLARVDVALSKIDKNEYGLCEVGGEVIPEDRLRVYPEAETCVEHAPTSN